MARSLSCFCGTVAKPQLTLGLVSLAKPAGMWINGERSGPPASSSSTLFVGSSMRRLAAGEPAATVRPPEGTTGPKLQRPRPEERAPVAEPDGATTAEAAAPQERVLTFGDVFGRDAGGVIVLL